ncbi:MAG: o-succinylbenzoate synthase [Bacteroidia bacterium]
MELQYSVELHKLKFKKPAKTSRNVFEEKLHWVVKLWYTQNPKITGISEAAPLEFLSPDYDEDLGDIIESRLRLLAEGENFENLDFDELPAIKFVIESALLDLGNGGKQVYFHSDYLTGKPIPINGLVWMGSLDEMLNEAIAKADIGFDCIKFKVGSHDFDAECRFFEQFRNTQQGKNVTIRLDANGAFETDEALEKLKELTRFNIHSIEQPIKAGQWDDMAKVCRDTKIPVALDEELIGIKSDERPELLKFINPQFLILKPTLLGGFKESDHWISLANKFKIGWWATSALEGNIGLNAISQWVGKHNISLPQGLGTGLLYENNFEAKSEIKGGNLFYKN